LLKSINLSLNICKSNTFYKQTSYILALLIIKNKIIMKTKIVLITATLLMSFNIFAQQTDPPKKNIIKTDLLDFVLTTNYHLNASYERLMSKHAGLELSFSFDNKDDAYTNYKATAGVAFRYYFTDDYKATGLYFSPFMRGNFSHYRRYSTDGNYNLTKYNNLWITAGVDIGYQWKLKNNITIDAYTGYEFNIDKPNVDFLDGFRLGLKLGYRF